MTVGQKLRYLLPSPSGVFKAISSFRPGNGSKKIYLRLAGYKTENGKSKKMLSAEEKAMAIRTYSGGAILAMLK
jgi:hypothetical protein